MEFQGTKLKSIKFGETVGTATQIADSLTTLDTKIENLKTAVSGGVFYKGNCTITDGVLSIVAPQKKGWLYVITSGSIIVNNVEYSNGDYIIVNEDVAEGQSLDGRLSFINSQDTDVAKLGKNNVFTVVPQTTGTPTASNDLTTKKYVDDAVAGATTSHYEGIRQSGESDSDAITRILNGASPKGGDTLVIKTLLSTGKYSYSAFVLDDSVNPAAWKAMDGNYDADNVYLTEDIVLAGNYTSVGNISKGSNTATKTISTAGKSIKSILTDMLSQDTQPSITAEPSISLTFKNGNTTINSNILKEVGETISLNWSATLNPGSYTAFANQVPTGVVPSSWSIQLRNNGTATDKSSTKDADSFEDIVLNDSDVYTIYAVAEYGNGAVAKTALGHDSNPEVRIAAGSKNVTSSKITAYRKSFYGTKINASDSGITSGDIRTLAQSSNAALTTGSTFTINIPIGAKSVVFAYPATLRDVTSVVDAATKYDVVSAFTGNKILVDVNDASGNNAKQYKVFYTNFANATVAANTYTVTI